MVLRTPEEKKQSKVQAQAKLAEFIPEMLGSVVGRHNAKKGAERIFLVFQNRRLNQQLLYTLADEIFVSLLPEYESRIRSFNANYK